MERRLEAEALQALAARRGRRVQAGRRPEVVAPELAALEVAAAAAEERPAWSVPVARRLAVAAREVAAGAQVVRAESTRPVAADQVA